MEVAPHAEMSEKGEVPRASGVVEFVDPTPALVPDAQDIISKVRCVDFYLVVTDHPVQVGIVFVADEVRLPEIALIRLPPTVLGDRAPVGEIPVALEVLEAVPPAHVVLQSKLGRVVGLVGDG